MKMTNNDCGGIRGNFKKDKDDMTYIQVKVPQIYIIVNIGLGQNDGLKVLVVFRKSKGVVCVYMSGMEFSFQTTVSVSYYKYI